MIRLRLLTERIRTSYWFVPSLMTLSAAGVAILAIAVDGYLAEQHELKLDWVYTGGAEGARQLLATVAGSMITVAGVVFSINIVGLSLASSQFGPRLLRNFMRDRGNQTVLGAFIATYVYCLLVLRTIRGENGGHEFVPQLSITLGVLSAIASVGVLIYFIHHSAVSLQAPVVIVNVYSELCRSIDELFPDSDDPEVVHPERVAISCTLFEKSRSESIRAPRDGYIESIDVPRLHELAREHDAQLELLFRPGHFVTLGSAIGNVRYRDQPHEQLPEALLSAIAIGSHQTPLQDVEFVINQLVEVAVRALSPGINDPFTALNCVDYLGAALSRLAGRKLTPPARFDADGTLRVILNPPNFPGLVDTAFRQIRQNAARAPSVLIRLLEAVSTTLEHASHLEDRKALLRQAELVHQYVEDLKPADAEALERRFNQIQAVESKRVHPPARLP
jgi:uncharacterized membrane protein